MVIIAKQNKERLIQYHTPHIFSSGYMASDIPGLNIKLKERKELFYWTMHLSVIYGYNSKTEQGTVNSIPHSTHFL